MALVQLLLRTPPLDKQPDHIRAVMYDTNCQPVPINLSNSRIQQNSTWI